MAWTPEAIIAVVGVLINVPTFCLVLWRVCRKKMGANNYARSLESQGSDAPLSTPRRFTLDPEYTLAMAYAVPLISVPRQPGRQ